MKAFYILSLFFVSSAFIGQVSYAQSLPYKALLGSTYDKNFPLVYPDQKELINGAILLDTREKNEFNVSHLKGAQWVGFETFDISSVKDIPKDQPIVVYCSIGARSQEIGKKLKQSGYSEVYNLYGGIFHWVNESNPVYHLDTLPTNKVHTFNKMWGVWLNKGEKVH
ncbi:rhodanese-like domain-containing protein [Cyclobacterium amurskyense]|jgi:rhodanese-related sulfurtransferase|uniref:Rhodanese-like domain protein n=1 Tax=Cyclobacterium amurskyense TaxID=320787 RepID=A0A0H4PCZ4_9BACT|nr:rhodanese-like domain-containing protein [Cyclobacterium amurskyense]AKP50995.1 Rhodanese-like domain protein [Cyclobacterium amurskyense]|tara:strand:- start:8653 stop:9153 length:501 start_codon:yes stop_codon:yes gene_type:complete